MRISSGAALTNHDLRVIQEVADAAEQEIRDHLPALDDQLRLVVDLGPRVIEETGEVGAALAPGVVAWTVDDSRPEGIAAIAQRHLRHTLFHELHHVVRGWTFYGSAPPDSFMHGVVSEGLATAFARDAAGEDAPWARYSDDVVEWVGELRQLPVDADYQHWMFRHPDGRRWIGYRAGTYLADQAIARSGRSAADLVRTPWADVLALAGF